jgi:hypothetical protein
MQKLDKNFKWNFEDGLGVTKSHGDYVSKISENFKSLGYTVGVDN